MKRITQDRFCSLLASFLEPCTTREFALLAFPDSKGWDRGRARGFEGGRTMAGASGVLCQLVDAELLERVEYNDGSEVRWQLTEKGERSANRFDGDELLANPIVPQSTVHDPPAQWFDAGLFFRRVRGVTSWWGGASWIDASQCPPVPLGYQWQDALGTWCRGGDGAMYAMGPTGWVLTPPPPAPTTAQANYAGVSP